MQLQAEHPHNVQHTRDTRDTRDMDQQDVKTKKPARGFAPNPNFWATYLPQFFSLVGWLWRAQNAQRPYLSIAVMQKKGEKENKIWDSVL